MIICSQHIRFVVTIAVCGVALKLCPSAMGQQRIFFPPADRNGAETFGWSIALSGNRLYVGDPYDGTLGLERGSIHGFNFLSGERLFATTSPEQFGNLGYDVAVVGNRVGAGARTITTSASEDGASFLFASLTGTQMHKVANPEPGPGDHFGTSIAAAHRVLVVGAPDDFNSGVFQVGRAYSINRHSGERTNTFTIPASDVGNRALFGAAIAEGNNNTVLIGAPGIGKVYAYDIDSAHLMRSFAATPEMQATRWGAAIEVAGDDLLVSDPLAYLNGELVGAVHLINGETGKHIRTFQSDVLQRGSQFGWSISAVGDYLLVGAPGELNQNPDSLGAAYLYRVSSGEMLRKFSPSENIYSEQYGWDVKLHGGFAFISAPTLASSDSRDRAGRVYMYAVPEPATATQLTLGLLALPLIRRLPAIASRRRPSVSS